MKFSRIFTITLLLFTVLMFNNHLIAVQSSTTTEFSGLRTNRLILNQDNLTFSQNETFDVLLVIQNINPNYNIYNLNFNYSIDKNLFLIDSSTNSTQTSNQWVYYNFDKIKPNETVTFTMTLQVSSNVTEQGVLISPMTLNYQFSPERIPGVSTTGSLSVNIQGINTSESLAKPVIGLFDVGSTTLAVIFALPIVLGFILSFIFGRRKNKA